MEDLKMKSPDITHEEVLLMKKTILGPNLLDFSDCVLTLILSNLGSYDLYRLSKTCTRFRYLIKERKLWKKLDIICHPMCAKKFGFFFDNVNNTTDTVMLSGISKKEKTLTSFHCHKLFRICENLTILSIENQYINSDEVRLYQFPKTLKELSLRGTYISGKQPFLQDAHKKLENLHTLILDDCKWFHEHSLMALSKLPNLENLSLYNCRNLNDSIAYMSVTTRFGFTKLLRIDARYTPVGDQFLKCFHIIKTLREVYLETPPICTNKRSSLLEEIKRWCTSNMQSVPNVVIFNQNHVNNVFKRNRNIKRAKKSESEPSSPITVKSLFREPAFNCLESCENCCIDTCGSMNNESLNYPVNYDKNISSEPHVEISNINNPQGPSNVPHVKFSYNFSDPTEKFQDNSINSELLFCEEISDSEDEMDFPIFHSDVTDAGVQWFGVHDPQGVDNLGNQSYLFRKPVYKECNCNKNIVEEKNTKEKSPVLDISEPGPSGLNQAGPSSENKSKRSTPFKTTPEKSDNSSSSHRVLLRQKLKRKSDQSGPEPKRNRSDKQSLTVDLNIGEGPVHLEIISENIARPHQNNENQGNAAEQNNDNNAESNNQAVQADVNEDSSSEDEENNQRQEQIVLRRETTPPREPNEVIRNRDLRVIIERLDPGLHIVIDRAGRILVGPRRPNNITKLKVFTVRGYKMITDQALRHLSELRLEILDVTDTSVTRKGIQEFLLVNPDCRVIHESICHCN